MATYLSTTKIQKLKRLTLCEAALRNLGLNVGDKVDIHFNESLGCLLISPVKNEGSDAFGGQPKSTGPKKKKR